MVLARSSHLRTRPQHPSSALASSVGADGPSADPSSTLSSTLASATLSSTTLSSASSLYAAPEVEGSHGPSPQRSAPTASCDIYSMGAVAFRLHHGADYKPRCVVPISGGEIDQLLIEMLREEPASRPSAQGCLGSPYFRASPVTRVQSEGWVPTAAARTRAITAAFRDCRNRDGDWETYSEICGARLF